MVEVKNETYEERQKRVAKEREEAQKIADAQARIDYVVGLRALADAIESRPNMPVPQYGYTVEINATVADYKSVDGKYQTVYDNEATLKALRAVTRAIPGRKEKIFLDWAFEVRKDFSPQVKYKVTASRAAVCKKIPTGNKIVHAASTQYIPERVEEEFTWDCTDGTLLKGVVDRTTKKVEAE
jgi:hypothetical protein